MEDMETHRTISASHNSEEDESSDEIRAGPFSDVIIDKPTSATSSLHNFDMDYLLDNEENFDDKISPLDDENIEDEEIRQIFGNSTGVNHKSIETESGSISSEDLEEVPRNSAFNDVIIDPVRGSISTFSTSGSALNSPIKSSAPSSRKTSANLLARQSVISPSSVKMSSDGNLADKLQHLTDTADTIKLRMRQSSNRGTNKVVLDNSKRSMMPNTLTKIETPRAPAVIDLDAALPPSGASTSINSSQNQNTSTKEFSEENQPWSNSSIPPLNKR
jgi:hypothetical protein